MQDSGDTGAKAAGETQKPLLRLGGQAGLSLFCALAQFRLIMFILGRLIIGGRWMRRSGW